MKNKDIFKKIAATAMAISTENGEDKFEIKSIEIIEKETFGLKIVPFNEKHGTIKTSFFEREGEIMFHAKKGAALNFTEKLKDKLSERFISLSFSTSDFIV